MLRATQERARQRAALEPGKAIRSHSTQALFRRFRRTGDGFAREELMARFMPLARKLAHRYHGAGEPLEDLVQVASMGLLKALNRYDERRGTSFTTYAVPTITGELKRHFRDNSWAVHVPRGTRDKALRIRATVRELSQRTGRRPAVSELAERLGLSESEVDDALGALGAFDAVSLDVPASGSGDVDGQLRSETIGAVDLDLEQAENRVTLNAALQELPRRERRILRMRFVEDRTQSEIASRIGVSQMQVSRILRGTLERLRVTIDRGFMSAAPSARGHWRERNRASRC